jgi:LysM repeat protein
MTTYTVQAGDTLSAIAAKSGVSVETIASTNGIANPNFIYVGQVLNLPTAGGAVTAPASPIVGISAPGAQPKTVSDWLTFLTGWVGTTATAYTQYELQRDNAKKGIALPTATTPAKPATPAPAVPVVKPPASAPGGSSGSSKYGTFIALGLCAVVIAVTVNAVSNKPKTKGVP